MPRQHNVILWDRVSLGSFANTLEKDLPINPISFISITLRLLNTENNAVPSLATILSKVATLEVLLEGKSLCSGSLADLAAMTHFLWGVPPFVQPISKGDDYVINVQIHIPFGRAPWRPLECLPATRKGDLSLRLTTTSNPYGVDGYSITAEVRQVLDVDPTSFLKYTTMTKTPSATGEHEVDLVVGPDYVGALLFGTTIPSGTSQNASIAKLKLKVDDLETLLPETRWESLTGQGYLRGDRSVHVIEHVHIADLEPTYTQYQNTGPMQVTTHSLSNYAYIDFDPLKDAEASYRLITRGRSRVHMVITADVADAIRILPVEMVPLVTQPAA